MLNCRRFSVPTTKQTVISIKAIKNANHSQRFFNKSNFSFPSTRVVKLSKQAKDRVKHKHCTSWPDVNWRRDREWMKTHKTPFLLTVVDDRLAPRRRAHLTQGDPQSWVITSFHPPTRSPCFLAFLSLIFFRQQLLFFGEENYAFSPFGSMFVGLLPTHETVSAFIMNFLLLFDSPTLIWRFIWVLLFYDIRSSPFRAFCRAEVSQWTFNRSLKNITTMSRGNQIYKQTGVYIAVVYGSRLVE